MAKAKPAPKPEHRQGENGYKYRQQYGLVIACKDEAHQQATYGRLCKLGYTPKVVCV